MKGVNKNDQAKKSQKRTHANILPKIVVTEMIIQGIVSGSRSHFCSATRHTIHLRPISFDSLPICTTHSLHQIQRVRCLAFELVSGAMELWDDVLHVLELFLRYLHGGRKSFHAAGEVDLPLAGNVVGGNEGQGEDWHGCRKEYKIYITVANTILALCEWMEKSLLAYRSPFCKSPTPFGRTSS